MGVRFTKTNILFHFNIPGWEKGQLYGKVKMTSPSVYLFIFGERMLLTKIDDWFTRTYPLKTGSFFFFFLIYFSTQKDHKESKQV